MCWGLYAPTPRGMEAYLKLKKIFSGLERAHGVFIPGDKKESGKVGGKAFILKEPVTDSHWLKHVSGTESLGIIPIRDDGTCSWCCIDVDKYNIDVKDTIKACEKLKLPMIACRSKSGGFHLFIFFKEPVPAKDARDKLKEIQSVLGFADCEIFPKQEQLLTERGDTGNFLNLPYHKGDLGGRYGYDIAGNSLEMDEFFRLVDQKAITHEELKNLSVKALKQKKNSFDGPPCLEILMDIGIFEGGRDDVVFHYCCYAKAKFGPGEWENKVFEFNTNYCQPPLSYQQVQQKVEQHQKKDYGYKCKDQPMSSHCNSSKCRIRKYGIGRDDLEMSIENLTKLESDESVWHLDVNGKRITVTTDELMDQKLFRKKVLEIHTSLPVEMSKRDYEARIREMLETCEVIKMPYEVTKEGRFNSHLDDFILNQHQADDAEDILNHAVYKEEGKIFFQLSSLERYLKKCQFKEFSTTQMGSIIRDRGGDSKRMRLGKTVKNLFWIPDPRPTDQDKMNLPKVNDDVPF